MIGLHATHAYPRAGFGRWLVASAAMSLPTDADRPLRVRMAPSPTGPLHIGTARTSLYNFLTARHAGGTYVLRIEDTDTARSTVEFEQDIIDNLHWLGINWDEGPQVAGGEDLGPHGPYRQSQRMALYASEADRLLASGAAYRCWCTPEELEAGRREQEARKEPPRYDRRCLALADDERAAFEAEGRRPAIRFKVEPGTIRFDDLVRGEVEFDNGLLGDFVIVRNDGTPLYHFVVVVDDEAMEISHVIRGEDHLSNTPKHIALIRALGYHEPRFGHIPLILNADRTKMSKRKSQTSMTAYREEGYLPEAMVNFLAFLGWSPGTEEEIFSLDELVDRFEIERVHKGGAIFDRDRLDHLNGVYIRSMTDEQLALRLRSWIPEAIDDEDLLRLVPLVKERLVKLADVHSLVAFVWEPDEVVASWYGPELLVPKKATVDEAGAALRKARATVAELADADFSADLLEQRCREAADAAGMKPGPFFTPLRVAVTGRTVSPPLFDSLELLGRDRSLARIDVALEKLGEVDA
jgi:nondiscriminating glutamyl-tRNA synthetase